MTREARLVDAARYALRVLDHLSHGQQDRVLSARELQAALEAYDDHEPSHDLDRQAWKARQTVTR